MLYILLVQLLFSSRIACIKCCAGCRELPSDVCAASSTDGQQPWRQGRNAARLLTQGLKTVPRDPVPFLCSLPPHVLRRYTHRTRHFHSSCAIKPGIAGKGCWVCESSYKVNALRWLSEALPCFSLCWCSPHHSLKVAGFVGLNQAHCTCHTSKSGQGGPRPAMATWTAS